MLWFYECVWTEWAANLALKHPPLTIFKLFFIKFVTLKMLETDVPRFLVFLAYHQKPGLDLTCSTAFWSAALVSEFSHSRRLENKLVSVFESTDTKRGILTVTGRHFTATANRFTAAFSSCTSRSGTVSADRLKLKRINSRRKNRTRPKVCLRNKNTWVFLR